MKCLSDRFYWFEDSDLKSGKGNASLLTLPAVGK